MTPRPKHSIPQPPLRDPLPTERVVRTAGLRFLLPCPYAEGAILSQHDADFLNTAWHTAIINRFSTSGIKDYLLAKPGITYDEIDRELQAFFETYEWSPRPTPTLAEPKPEALRDKPLETYARTHFRAVAGGRAMPRAEYENTFREWFANHDEAIRKAYNMEKIAAKALTRMLEAEDED